MNYQPENALSLMYFGAALCFGSETAKLGRSGLVRLAKYRTAFLWLDVVGITATIGGALGTMVARRNKLRCTCEECTR